MKCQVASSLIVLAIISPASSEEVLREMTWTELREAGQLAAGAIQPAPASTATESLKIDNPEGKPKSVSVLVLDKPGIAASRYALTGRVRYEGMEGKGYLEMWNSFPGGERCFTRTLGRRGMLGSLEGSSDWRPFSLPFSIREAGGQPTQLEMNVVFAGRGTVYLSSLRLVQYAAGEDPLAVPGQWWDGRTAGLVGGIAGTVIGCLGGLIGMLAGVGKAREFVMLLTAAIVLAGVACLALAIVALLQTQPYCVYYPLLLLGGLSVLVMGPLRRTLRQRYQQLELRKIAALDVACTG
jgi:hypothetical protein